MNSREFIYEFSNFDDIKSRENDKKSRAHDIFAHAIGVKCGQNQRSCTKQPLRLREMGVLCRGERYYKNRDRHYIIYCLRARGATRRICRGWRGFVENLADYRGGFYVFPYHYICVVLKIVYIYRRHNRLTLNNG